MNLKIKKLILWPKDINQDLRIISFHTDYVNVISGDNAKGKSAIISIVDYCLASSKCNIPTGLIRRLTSWFGVVFQLDDEELLIARKEPGISQVSNEMFLLKSKSIIIPEHFDSNIAASDVILELNKYAGLSKVNFTFNDNEKGFTQSASIRDLISLNFQPQYIIANPYALFYKADTHKNREKLITILPYILGVIDDKILELKEELKDLKRNENSLSREYDKRKDLVNNWLSEIKSYYAISYELGLINDFQEKDNWTYQQYIKELRKALDNLDKNRLPLIEAGASVKIAQRIAELNEVEYAIAMEIQDKKERLSQIEQIRKSNIEYGNDVVLQNKRLASTDWFKKHISNLSVCPFCKSKINPTDEYLKKVYHVSEELTFLSRKVSDSHKVFSKEISSLNSNLNSLEIKINDTRKEKDILTQEDEQHKNQRQVLNRIFKFGGKLEEALSNYDKISENSEIENKLSLIRKRIKEIERIINQDRLAKVQENILSKIGKSIGYYAGLFNAEYCKENILFDISNLTLKFISTNRNDYLWEIGSGHNFMAYHIATIFAIQEYLLTINNNKVPQFVILDQPSQVYFVESENRTNEGTSKKERALIQVEKIFEVFSKFKERTNSNIQLIVLEHAGESLWNNYQNDIKQIRNWRDDNGKALIPKDWIND